MIQESLVINGIAQQFHPLVPEVSYLIGLIQADGHLEAQSRDRGKLRLEMQAQDRELLERLQKVIPFYSSISTRVRDTNFKEGSESCTLTAYDQEFRDLINQWGVPYGRKSEIVAPPTVPFSTLDYVRGMIDGNGSVAISSQNKPLISLTTPSNAVVDFYIGFLASATGKAKKQANRNKRDNIYNIVVFNEDAVLLANLLYYDGCLALERKQRAADQVKKWVRPDGMRISPKRDWDADEDTYILAHSIEESMTHLGRTKQSVQMRLWRLQKSA